MTTARQLYSLQEVDLALDAVASRQAEVERQLGAGLLLEPMEAALEAERERLRLVSTSHRDQQLEADSLRERATQLSTQLYGGAINNPRELQPLEQEVAHVGDQLRQRDSELLALTLQADEYQNRCTALEKELRDTQTVWEHRQAEFRKERDDLAVKQQNLAAQRSHLAARLEPAELKRYDGLRRVKAGRAVAKVERGLCQDCRMSLPTQQLQRLRTGRQTVLCSSCGRILFVS